MSKPVKPHTLNLPGKDNWRATENTDYAALAGLAYLGAWTAYMGTLLIFILKKDDSEFIKFHCLQSVAFMLDVLIVGLIVTVIQFLAWVVFGVSLIAFFFSPPVGAGGMAGFLGLKVFQWLFGLLATLPIVIYWLVITIQAFRGKTVTLPFAGGMIARRFCRVL